MPKPFVVPGICRYTVKGTFFGRAVYNVLDVHIDTTPPGTRSDACRDAAGILINEWSDSILPILPANYTATEVAWVDLDTATGTTGTRNTTSLQTWPKPGILPMPPFPANVATLVRKNISGSRAHRRGRMYLIGPTENETSSSVANTISATHLSAVQTKLNAFQNDFEQEDGSGGTYTSKLAVVHITERWPLEDGQKIGSPKAGTFEQCQNLTVDSTLATQRRRLRG